MTEPLDISALRAKLRVYDQTLPRCTKVITRVSNHAPDYVAEEERAEWDMRLSYPCSELEGHEGPCREGRAILGWPGFKTLTALLDEVERLRAEVERTEHLRSSLDTALMLERERERAVVVAWLLKLFPNNMMFSFMLNGVARRIACGEHRRKEKP